MSSVNTVQVSGGEFSMLIGPQTSGQILKRDTTGTIFTDNGLAYDAYAVVGSILLAKPGTLVGIQFVYADCIKVGNKPTVGILLDEFSRLPTTPQFSNMQNSVTDPKIPQSDTRYLLRYYCLQTGESVWCMDASFKFEFGTDTVRNELNAYAIYGQTVNE
jgi:hypothetical protein